MWESDYKESSVPKNWCFWTVVWEKTLESPLDCKEIQPVHPRGDQAWVFIGRTDAEAETLILWPPDGKSSLIWKYPDVEERVMMMGKTEGGRRGHDRMKWLDGITDSMDMSLVNSGKWWWTGKPGMLWSMGSQRVGHDWATELNWTEGLNPHPLQWKREVLTTGAPGKSSQFSFLVSANQVTLHWPTRRLSKKDASLWLTNFWVSSAHGTVHILIAHSLGMCRAQVSYSWQHGEFAPVFSTTVQFCHYKKLNTAWPWPLANSLWNFLLCFYSEDMGLNFGREDSTWHGATETYGTTTEARMPKVQAPKQEKSVQWEAHMLPPESGPHLPHLQRACKQQWRPSTVYNKNLRNWKENLDLFPMSLPFHIHYKLAPYPVWPSKWSHNSPSFWGLSKEYIWLLFLIPFHTSSKPRHFQRHPETCT